MQAKRRVFYLRERPIVESELADLGSKGLVREPSLGEVGVPGVCLVRVPEDGDDERGVGKYSTLFYQKT